MQYDDGHHLAAAQLATDYLLRAVDAANRHLDGDLTMGAILIAVVQANLARLDQDAIDPPKPVTGGFLAAKLGIPNETVRRKINALLEAGFLVRKDGGLAVPSEVLSRPEVASLLRANFLNLRRLYASLLRSGYPLGEAGEL